MVILCLLIDTIDTSNFAFWSAFTLEWNFHHLFSFIFFNFQCRHHHHHHNHHRKKRHKRKILVHDLDEQSVKVSTTVINRKHFERMPSHPFPNVYRYSRFFVFFFFFFFGFHIVSIAGNRSGRFITTCPLDNHCDRMPFARNVFTIGRCDTANGTVNRWHG